MWRMNDAPRPDGSEQLGGDASTGPAGDPTPDPPAVEHRVHLCHMHVHDVDCGHPAIAHEGHLDYLHDGHRHARHGTHYDEH